VIENNNNIYALDNKKEKEIIIIIIIIKRGREALSLAMGIQASMARDPQYTSVYIYILTNVRSFVKGGRPILFHLGSI